MYSTTVLSLATLISLTLAASNHNSHEKRGVDGQILVKKSSGFKKVVKRQSASPSATYYALPIQTAAPVITLASSVVASSMATSSGMAASSNVMSSMGPVSSGQSSAAVLSAAVAVKSAAVTTK